MTAELCEGVDDAVELVEGEGVASGVDAPLGVTLGDAPLDSVELGVPVPVCVGVPEFELVGVGDAVPEGVALGD